MEDGFKKLLERHRDRFRRAVTVERLFSPLVVRHVLTSDELQTLQNESPVQRLDSLIDILTVKDYEAFKRFCVVLETTYPYMLNCMFLGVEPPSLTGSAHGRKSDQGQLSEKDVDVQDRHIQCVNQRVVSVGRSVSMTGRDLCKDRLSLLNKELKIVTRDLDHVKRLLQKAENERDNAYHELAELTGHKNVERIEDENSPPINSTNLSNDRNNEYEKLKSQYVSTLTNLEMFRHQNTELSHKFDSAAKEADYFRKHHKTGLTKCDILVREAQSLQRKLEEVIRDRHLVRQEYEEIVLLREREKIELLEIKERHFSDEMDVSHSTDVLSSAIDKYEALQKDHEELRETHRVLRGEYNHTFNHLQSLETDYSSMKDQYENLLRKHETLLVENSSMKQQCSSAVRNYEKTLKELDSAIKMSQQAHNQRDCAFQERDQAVASQMKKNKELSRLTDERNAVLREYQLVMSERDIVHQEIEKLQEEINSGKAQNKSLLTEKERLVNESDSLHRELNEHDKLLKENFILKEKLNHVLIEKDQIARERDMTKDDYEMFQQERDAARKERSEAIIHRDKILKECFEIKQRHEQFLHGENHEAEGLRRRFEVLSSELSSALHEVEVSKSQRDWAFSERDKIVQESDSMRLTCDKLRQERDSAVSDLAELLQDSDQIRRAHMEELSDLRSRVEKHLREDNKRELVSSRDSAIDTDSIEWETETVSLERPSHEEDLGIAIAGGRDAPHLPNDSSIVITNVAKGSVADGKLRVNDCVLKVNNIDLTNVEHNIAVQAINHAEVLNLLVKRKRSSSTKSLVQPVQLVLSEGKELGIQIDFNKCISFISPGSIADDATLDIGDKIITINGKSVENLSQMEAENLLSTSMVTLAIVKPSRAMSGTHVLQSVLEEVSEKIANDIDMCQKMDRQIKANPDITNLPSQKRTELYNPKRRAALDSNMSSSPESSSEHALNMSLTPLYEEKSQGTQTDSSDVSIGHSSELLDSFHSSNQFPTPVSTVNQLSDRSQQHIQSHSPHFSSIYSGRQKERPPPPMRTCSYMSAVTSSTTPSKSFQDTESESQDESLPVETVHFPSNSLPDSSVVETESKVLSRSRAQQTSRQLRPQSAPSSRHKQKLPYQGRYSTNFETSLYESSQHQPSTPPASMAVLKSRNVPYYTAKSVTLPTNGITAESQQCTAVQCWNSRHMSLSHSGLSSSSDQYSSVTRHSRQGSASSVGSSHRSHSSHSRYHMTPKASKVSRKAKRVSLLVSTNCQSSSMSSLSSGQMTPRIEQFKTLHFDFSAEDKQLDARRDYEPRIIQIEKKDTLGISIAQGTQGGVFICLVTPSSVAYKSGLRYGDQILEYNGVNLRCATYEQAAKILKESGSNVTILAQYSPQKFLDAQLTGSSPSEASSAVSTPVMTKRRSSSCKAVDNMVLPLPEKVPLGSNIELPGEVRVMAFKKKSQSLGFSIVGGNATGVFVSEIEQNSPAIGTSDLCVGDQILEFNGIDLTSATMEEATLELCKPTETVDLIAQYNPSKFNVAQEQPGDSFYVRALFERTAHSKEELSFKKGNILYITDTMHHGHVGCWKACLVSEEDAQKRENGIVPSRMKAEQEILLRHSISHCHGDEKFVGRRSLFRRSKKGVHGMTINHSRESSDSATSMTASCTDLIMASYQIVEKLDSHTPRAVIVLAPLVEIIYEKLCQEAPYKFLHCKPELINISEDELESVLSDGTLVDHAWKGSQLTCTTLASIRKVTDKHCLLNVGSKAVERLHALQVYPIIVFVKFKSAKHLRQKTQAFNLRGATNDQDSKDGLHTKGRLGSKDAKDLFEQSLKVEKENKQLFNAVIHGGSLKEICSQIQDVVVEQQKRAVWVPLSSI